jgi:hypothetical protein
LAAERAVKRARKVRDSFMVASVIDWRECRESEPGEDLVLVDNRKKTCWHFISFFPSTLSPATTEVSTSIECLCPGVANGTALCKPESGVLATWLLAIPQNKGYGFE